MGTDGALGNAVRPAMSEGLRFAWEGASTLQEVAYRYEYFKALYDTEKTKILDEHKDMPKSNKLKMASDRMTHPSKDPQENLDSDIKVIHEMHSGKKIDIDLDQSDEEIISSLRRQAEEVGMGHDISTAYHARKHAHLIPEEEQEGHPVRTYLSSLRKTVKEGEVKNFRRLEDGPGVSLGMERRIPQKESEKSDEKTSTLRSRLFIRPHTGIVASTYGKGKTDDLER